jgi:Domain of unknown function (DUF222)
MGSHPVFTAIAAMRAAYAELAAASIDTLTHPELLSAQGELEALARQMPPQGHRMMARLAAEASPTDLGATCLRDVLASRLRIARAEARRRIDDAAVLGPRTALTGEVLHPVLAVTAAAQGDGLIGADHVRVIRRFFDHLAPWVDVRTREQAEATLVRVGSGLDPDALRTAAHRLAALIDQDGPLPDEAEHARKRGLWIGKQGADGMTPFKGTSILRRGPPGKRSPRSGRPRGWATPPTPNPESRAPPVRSRSTRIPAVWGSAIMMP